MRRLAVLAVTVGLAWFIVARVGTTHGGYATLALVTDYDVWHETAGPVNVEEVIQNLVKNTATAKDVLRQLIPGVGGARTCACPSLLKDAVITHPSMFPLAARRRLDLLIGKYFPLDLKKKTGRAEKGAESD